MRFRNRSLALALAIAGLAVAGRTRADDGASSGLAERVTRLEQDLAIEKYTETARRGAKLFARACAACHGTGGKGDGQGAADLDPPPRDLTSRRFRFRTTPSGDLPRPEDLERTIRKGLPGSAMPGFGDLFSEDQLADLIGFVYSLRPETSPPWEPEPAIVLATVVSPTSETIEPGRALDLLMGCDNCHGTKGNGKGPSAKGLTDDLGRPMRSTDFRHDPLKGGRTPEDIVRTLRTGLNGAPMPSYDDAMLFAREDFDPATFDPDDRGVLEAFLDGAPARADLATLDESGLAALRNERLAALTGYVLSIDRRRGFGFRLFGQEPEREPRKERGGRKDKTAGEEDFWDE